MGLKEKRILLKVVFQPLCPQPASPQHHHAPAFKLLFNHLNVSSMTPLSPPTTSRAKKFWRKSMELAVQCTPRQPTVCSRSTLSSAPSSLALAWLPTAFYASFRLAVLVPVVERRQMRVSRPDHQTQATTSRRSLKNNGLRSQAILWPHHQTQATTVQRSLKKHQEAKQFPDPVSRPDHQTRGRTEERGGEQSKQYSSLCSPQPTHQYF